MYLSQLALGERAVVVAVENKGALAIRLLEMGFVSGTTVQLIKRAPMGDPLVISVRGYHISLRSSEAGAIRVARERAHQVADD
jgi:Fe2+ transport system protein FeoA